MNLTQFHSHDHQVQSNALAALEAIDVDMADEVLAAGCITGDRVNGLCDGVTGDWCAHIPLFHLLALLCDLFPQDL